jgi:hypothetical protein
MAGQLSAISYQLSAISFGKVKVVVFAGAES